METVIHAKHASGNTARSPLRGIAPRHAGHDGPAQPPIGYCPSLNGSLGPATSLGAANAKSLTKGSARSQADESCSLTSAIDQEDDGEEAKVATRKSVWFGA